MAAPTTFLNPKNNARSRLAASIGAADTTLTVSTGDGAKFPNAPFVITVDNEIMRVTSKTGDTFTVTRAVEGTTAASHSSGALVELRVTAGAITEIQTAVNNLESAGQLAGVWRFATPAANTAATNADLLGGAAGENVVVVERAKSLGGIAIWWVNKTGGTTGTLTVRVKVNGTPAMTLTLGGGATKNYSSQSAGVNNLAAGDELTVDYSTDASWDGAGGSILVYVYTTNV